MPGKRYKPEEIVTKLRQVDVLVSQGSSVADAIRQIGLHLRRHLPQGGQGRRDISTQETLDTYYVRNWSPWIDIYILISTIPAVLSGSGAR